MMNMEVTNMKDETIAVRIKDADKKSFVAKAAKLSIKPADLLREFIKAFNEGRLKLKPKQPPKEYYE